MGDPETGMERDEVWLTCIHEAGHIIAAAAIGCTPKYAAAMDNGRGLAVYLTEGIPRLHAAIVSQAGPSAELGWPHPPDDCKLPPAIAQAPHEHFDFTKTPRLREQIEDPGPEASDDSCISEYVFRRRHWAFRLQRVRSEAESILLKNEDILLAVAGFLYKRHFIAGNQLAPLMQLVERWDETEYGRLIDMQIDKLLNEVVALDEQPLAIYGEHVALVAEGQHIIPASLREVLKAADKKPEEFRKDVEILQHRMKLADTVAEGMNREPEINKAKAAIALANEEFEKAGRKRDAAVIPHQRRLEQIYELQREGERARDELVRTCPHRKLLDANAANNAELEAIDHRMKQLRDGYNIARHDRIGGLTIKQLEEEHAERSKQRDKFESDMAKP